MLSVGEDLGRPGYVRPRLCFVLCVVGFQNDHLRRNCGLQRFITSNNRFRKGSARDHIFASVHNDSRFFRETHAAADYRALTSL